MVSRMAGIKSEGVELVAYSSVVAPLPEWLTISSATVIGLTDGGYRGWMDDWLCYRGEVGQHAQYSLASALLRSSCSTYDDLGYAGEAAVHKTKFMS